MNTRVVVLIVLLMAGAPAFASQGAVPPLQDSPKDASEWQGDSDARLRVSDASLARLVRLGLEQSAILRGLIADIESGDVVVYVGRDVNMPGRLAGRLTFLGQGGAIRYVRVSINWGLLENVSLAALAHELQHVREIMAHPEVQDSASLATLYRRIGRESQVAGRVAFETEAAQRVSHAVRYEMAGTKAARAVRASEGSGVAK